MKLFKRRAKTESGSGSQSEGQKVTVDAQPSEEALVPAAQLDGSPASTPSAEADHREEALPDKPAEPGMFERLRAGVGRSRSQLSEGLASLVLGKKQLDPALMEALEEHHHVGFHSVHGDTARLRAALARGHGLTISAIGSSN